MKILTILLLALFTTTLQAALEFASPFTDHMVLQRSMDVPVWGTADPGAVVVVKFSNQIQHTTADSQGKWNVSLSPLKASTTPEEMSISSGSTLNTKILSDILVGEVWICSGQSNMGMTVGAVPEIKALSSTNIRSFTAKRTVAFEEQDSCEGQWTDVHPNSAVAFAFAHSLQKSAEVPVGIILAAWGSSSIEAWMPRDMTETTPHFKTMMDEFDANTETQERIQSILTGPKPWSNQDDIFLRRQPNILYNAMIKPFAPYACQGIVWYQGERQTKTMHGMPKEPWFARTSGMLNYGDVLKNWIQRYRQEWNKEELNFLIVMLPGFGKILDAKTGDDHESPDVHSWAWMRESQLRALELPHTAVVNTIDLGDIKDIHPKDKLPIGERLALLAARDTLKKKGEAQGPTLKKVKRSGDELIVHFEHAKGIKTIDGHQPTGFWIANDSDEWIRARATIKGKTVILSSSEIQKPLYVRYAFAGKPRVNLVNEANLPAYPFRTDRFEP